MTKIVFLLSGLKIGLSSTGYNTAKGDTGRTCKYFLYI